jgi:hypothetical protein
MGKMRSIRGFTKCWQKMRDNVGVKKKKIARI